MASGGTLFIFIFLFFRRGIFSEFELEALPEALLELELDVELDLDVDLEALLEFDVELELLLELDVVDFTTLDKA